MMRSYTSVDNIDFSAGSASAATFTLRSALPSICRATDSKHSSRALGSNLFWTAADPEKKLLDFKAATP